MNRVPKGVKKLNFLFEIGLEELPAQYVDKAEKDLKKIIEKFDKSRKFKLKLFFRISNFFYKFCDCYISYFIFHLDKNAKDVEKIDFKFDTLKTLQSKFRIIDGTFEKQK